ncbi:hypothetical protein MNB_SUP05-SYMBIONT-7-105 [hydrothermal vent metagenome]|uniref:Uncharacterized protein n=1 Tax=hydrothermal vent metagenome TaxID=652676 RepID=A0A1W1E6D2_9ZZZZ
MVFLTEEIIFFSIFGLKLLQFLIFYVKVRNIMNSTQQKISITTIGIIAIAGLITLLNISKPTQPTTSVFNTPNLNTTSNNTQKNTSHPPNSKPDSKNKQNNNPFNSNQANNAPNPHFPPGFPEPLPPLDPAKLKQNDDLIAQGDAIVAEMNTLIAGLDLPKIKLSAAEQAQLNTQRQIQQTRLEDIKTQLEILQGALQ